MAQFFIILYLVSYPWPIRPFYPPQNSVPHHISATLGDARDTVTNPRFHRGIDIPDTNGTDVFSIVSDTAFVTADYVRVGNYVYIHIIPTVEDSEYVIGILQDSINPTRIGVIMDYGPPGPAKDHLHLQIGPAGGLYNFLDFFQKTL